MPQHRQLGGFALQGGAASPGISMQGVARAPAGWQGCALREQSALPPVTGKTQDARENQP